MEELFSCEKRFKELKRGYRYKTISKVEYKNGVEIINRHIYRIYRKEKNQSDRFDKHFFRIIKMIANSLNSK